MSVKQGSKILTMSIVQMPLILMTVQSDVVKVVLCARLKSTHLDAKGKQCVRNERMAQMVTIVQHIQIVLKFVYYIKLYVI